MLSRKPSDYLLASASFIIFTFIGYGLLRYQTASLLLSYSVLFGLYLFVIGQRKTLDEAQLNFWIIASIVFRASLLFSVPNLSDDFYRFIWDGRILAAGANPFSEVPSYYMNEIHSLPGLDENLYQKLNSQHRYSSYPPVCQFIYWLSAKLSPDSIYGSVLIIKNCLVLFEVATIWIIRKLITQFNLPPSSVLIYALNPLVILEISGNVHFEGIMIFFLMAAILLLTRNRMFLSGTAYALSVCTKLIPLLFLPLYFHSLGKRRALQYWLLVGLVVILLYIPLLNADIVRGYTTSLGYYFQRFEFNASIYYLIRGLGYIVFGFNIIQYAGPFLALTATVAILYIASGRSPLHRTSQINPDLFKAMVWCLFIYFLSTTILHPWYIITLLTISIFAGYRFPMVWTGMIFLTYAGYTGTGYEETPYLVALEYLVVVVVLLFETVWKRRKIHS